MKHFNRTDLTNEWGNEIDERYVITEESMDDCDIVVDYRHDDVGKVVYDRASDEFYYDDDVAFVGVFLVDEEDCQDFEYFCFNIVENEK